jgi:monovalent cation:H+ antiporter-2, CPA2 family
MNAHHFLQALTIVLCVAAATTILFQRLRQPVVLGYILAGLLIGPHVPFPLVADMAVVQTLSEVGVILLMFALGLEFSPTKLIRVGPPAALTAVIQGSILLWLGFIAGRFFGWTTMESLFAGSAIAISSTTIIAKSFADQNVRGRLRDLVVGILLVEDLIAVILMAVLTATATGVGLTPAMIAATAGRLFIFLFALIALGLLVVPRATRAVLKLNSNETTLIAVVGFCFGCAFLAMEFGYSVALGAFIAGSLIGESGHERRIERLVQPVRDVFAAIFFVSVGMLLDPRLVLEHWKGVVVFTLLVIVGNLIAVSVGAFLAGNGVHTAIRAAMSLTQIGEFSFIIAALGLSLKATRPFLYPIIVAVSALTTLTTPFMIRYSDRAANAVDRRLPRPIQTFAALYGGWLERSRRIDAATDRRSPVRRFLLMLLLDVALLCALIIGTSVYLIDLGTLIERQVGSTVVVARSVVLAAAVALGIPLWFGVMRVARRLSEYIGQQSFPVPPADVPDLSAAPRRALVATFKIFVLALVGLPIVALTQPFLPGYPAAGALTFLLTILVIAFWRTTTNLEGHVRAGAQALLAVAKRGRDVEDPKRSDGHSPLDNLLAAFGSPRTTIVTEDSEAAGKSLRDINLRGRTGATVLAIQRAADNTIVIPTAGDVLASGDLVAIGGSGEAVDAAVVILGGT